MTAVSSAQLNESLERGSRNNPTVASYKNRTSTAISCDARLLNHLVRAAAAIAGSRRALSPFRVDHEIVFRRLLDSRSPGFAPRRILSTKTAKATHGRMIGIVGRKASCCHEISSFCHCEGRFSMTGDLVTVEKRVVERTINASASTGRLGMAFRLHGLSPIDKNRIHSESVLFVDSAE
jgi:hypothetical protein